MESQLSKVKYTKKTRRRGQSLNKSRDFAYSSTQLSQTTCRNYLGLNPLISSLAKFYWFLKRSYVRKGHFDPLARLLYRPPNLWKNMTSEIRLRPYARPACDARFNHSRTDSSCCDGNSSVDSLAKNCKLMSLRAMSHSYRTSSCGRIYSPLGNTTFPGPMESRS